MLRIWTVLRLGTYALGAMASAASALPQSQCDLKSISASLAASNRVPSLRGCSPADAERVLGQFDYRLNIEKRVHSNEIPEGLIVRDRVQSGTVDVDVSTGPSDNHLPLVVTDIMTGLTQVATPPPAAPPAAASPPAEPAIPPLGDPANPFTHIIYPTVPTQPPPAQPPPTEPVTPAPTPAPAQPVAPTPVPAPPTDTNPPPPDTGNDIPPHNQVAHNSAVPPPPVHGDTSTPAPPGNKPPTIQKSEPPPTDIASSAGAPQSAEVVQKLVAPPVARAVHSPWWMELLSKTSLSRALIWTLGTILAGAGAGLFLLPRASCSIEMGKPNLGSTPLRRRWPDLTVTTVIGAVSVSITHPLPTGRRADAEPRTT